jgi:hypothetical protein
MLVLSGDEAQSNPSLDAMGKSGFKRTAFASVLYSSPWRRQRWGLLLFASALLCVAAVSQREEKLFKVKAQR